MGNHIATAATSTMTGQMTRFYADCIRRDADGNLVKSSQSSVASSQIGSAGLTTSIAGAKVAELRYLPFGETRWAWGATPTDRRYTGQREVAAIGLYDYNARMYWPAVGRFVSADSIIPDSTKAIDFNRYAYAHGNPLRYTDPTGHCGYTYCIPSGNPYQAIVIGQSIPIVPRYPSLPALTVSPPQVSVAGPASAVFAQADMVIGPVLAAGAEASTLAAMAAAGAGATQGAGHVEQGGESAGPGGAGGGGFGEKPKSSEPKVEDIQRRIRQLHKGIRSLEKRITEHQIKLEQFRQNPEAFDNQEVQKNAPTADIIHKKIIPGRIRHLENEIATYQREIQKMRSEIERLRRQ